MPIHLILLGYAMSWGLALIGNAAVELARLRAERGVAAWIDYTGFVLTFWLVLPILPLIAMVVSLQRRDWLAATLRGRRSGRLAFKEPRALAAGKLG